MGFKKNSGKLLLELYKRKINGNSMPTIKELIELTNWEPHTLKNAINYCKEKNYIKLLEIFGSDKFGIQNMIIQDITSEVIDIIENTNDEVGKKEFNTIFNLTINNEFNIESIVKGEVKLF
jgi:hypothetical protein